MYLLPAGQPARGTTKWSGLGAFRLRKGLDVAGMAGWPNKTKAGMSHWRVTKMRALRGLGDDAVYDIEGNPIQYDIEGNPLPASATPGIAPSPSQPGVNPSIQQAYANLLTTQQNSKDPLDYTSPQAAIAAGVPAQTTYNAWSTSIAKFPTQQAALQAGIPAGVVTQLWAQSRSAAPAAAPSFFSGTTLGLPNTLLLAGGGLLALLGMSRGRR
jgi:hypothetical protein